MTIAPTDAAAQTISAALAHGCKVQLLPGQTYLLSEPIRVPSGGVIEGDAVDPPLLAPDDEFVGHDGADDPRNSLLQGWAEASASTTLNRRALKASSSLELVDASIVSIGQWLRISGNNAGSDSAGVQDGGAVIKSEVVQVVSVEENEVVVSAPLAQTHGSGALVEVIEPLLDVQIGGIRLVGSGRTTATGIFIADAVGARIDVAVGEVSRSGVELRGSRDSYVVVRGEGACNAVVFLDSTADTDVSVQTRSGGRRTHPEGVPRGIVTMRHRCSGVVLADSRLEGGCTGVSVWGGTAITIRDCEIRDMRLHERAARDSTIPRDGYGGVMSAAGIEVNGFISPSDVVEHGFGLGIRNVLLEDCRHPEYGNQSSVLLVDQQTFVVDGLSITNLGSYATVQGNWMAGLSLVDVFDGSVDNLVLRGVVAPLRFWGGWVRCDFGKVEVQMPDALGDNYSATIVLECGSTSSQPTEIYIDELSCGVTSELLATGRNFVSDVAKGFSVGSLRVNHREYSSVILAKNMTDEAFQAGSVAELAPGPGTAAGLVDATHTDVYDKGIVVNGPGLGFCAGTGWLCVARGVATARVEAGIEVWPGDGLGVAVGGRVLVLADGPVFGVALDGRPASSSALVRIGSV